MAGKLPNTPKLDPKEEEQMMEFFTQQVLLLQEKARLQASVREEKKLLVENAKLKKDIDDLKTKLQDTKKRKAKKLHQEKVLTASVTAMKSTVTEEPVPPTQNSHTHTDGGRRRHRRGPDPTVACGQLGGSERDSGPDVSLLELRVGRVLSVRTHPDSDSLYIQEVDVGEPSPRSVVSGLASHATPQQLQDSLAVLLCNVRPVKVRGVQSQARVLCAVSQSSMEPLEPPSGAAPGDRVTFHNYPGGAVQELNPKRRVWERLQPDLSTDSRGVANYKGVAFEVKGKGLCRAPTISNGAIK